MSRSRTFFLIAGASVLFFLLLVGGASADGSVSVNLGDDILVLEDSAVTFNPSVTYTGTKGLSYHWDFGDGSTSSLQNPTKTYTREDTYTVSLTVTDDDGVSGNDTVNVAVNNARPIANAGGPRTVYEGTTVTFDGSNSWDTSSDLPLLTYQWDFGDGWTTGASTDNKVVTHTYAEAGVYVTTLVVRDDDWKSSNFAFVQCQSVSVNGTSSGNGLVNFYYDLGNASGSSNSSSGGGAAIDVYWDFGDGSWGEGNCVSHNYSSDGTYLVTLVITDAFGAMSVHSIWVTVLNSPPSANAGVDVAGDEDEELAFIGSGTDPGGGPLAYSWSFDDGNSAEGQEVVHAFTKQGTYTVTLTVTDADGLTATDTCKATITNVPPTAGLTSNHTTEEGDLIGFYGTTSTDTPSDLPLLTYSWDLGDGTTATGISVSHAYADEGTYTVTLTVTDDDSAVDTMTMSVPVDNADPTATIVSVTSDHSTILPGDDVAFEGSATDPGKNDVLSYSWDFGDGNTGTDSKTNHSYSSDGTYTVTLTVTDGDGGSGTATTTVAVEAQEDLAGEALTEVEEATSSSFSKPKDQEKIEDGLEDLIEALEDGNTGKARGKCNALEAQVKNKVTDATLKQYLLDVIDHIRGSLD